MRGLSLRAREARGAGGIATVWSLVFGAGTMVAACGGGGNGIQSIPAPIASPTPTPTPTQTTPTPAPTQNYDTAGYRATAGAVAMNALAAYQRGATGAGVALGVIDSGVDDRTGAFTGRISSASADVAGARGTGDLDGHGTAVAFTALGGRNGNRAQGVAFDATLVALRADEPGSCGGSTENGGLGGTCSFSSDAIARGLDTARNAGARVVNISLGSNDTPPSALLAAIGRATAAGMVIVIAAGNDGESNPTLMAQIANNNAVARGQVIIAGSVNAGGSISTFSNRAGQSAAHYLTALGERVEAPDAKGERFLWSGTSFAAPQISGAVALLAQAFPNLTGAQIADLLLRTAREAGTSGTDDVYGRGTLDLTAAFRPVGSTSVAGTGAAVSMGVNARLSPAMGDSRSEGLTLVALDGYARAYHIDISATVAQAAPRPMLAPSLLGRIEGTVVSDGTRSIALTRAITSPGEARLRAIVPTDAPSAMQRIVAGSVTQTLTPDTAIGFGFASTGDAMVSGWTGQSGPAYLMTDPGAGMDRAPRAAAALHHVMGRVGVSVAAENGRFAAPMPGMAAPGYDQMTMTFDRRLGPIAATLGVTRLDEQSTVLGGWFGGALGQARGRSWFADGAARWQDDGGWTLGARWRSGWTRAIGGLGGGMLASRAWSVEAGKAGLFGHDRIDLRLSRPLRVSGGGLDLRLPGHWDYASGQVDGWTSNRLSLAPTGQETLVELRHGIRLGGGEWSTHLFWRRDPGNITMLPPERGMAVKYGLTF
ncbi:S8 family peptidase [Sphingomonas yabuuchiae]|uniref:S8 family serine peptidase n=1 Tax=Sphingomonas yabuuchiae TaxID=172044 RepID=A0AA41DDD2_9SPHN|nr:S8 family peptidase [Sphingomonas yabuuchiae]MBN3559754.1 S8 family serine peptidase [Sphingomonas yabuuchiae]